MPPDDTPTTEAGRSLLGRKERDELWHPIDGRRDETLTAIRSIEAEARDRALTDALAAMHDLLQGEYETAVADAIEALR